MEGLRHPYRSLHRKSPEILEVLQHAPIYEKHVLVRARRAIPGEHIATTLLNGHEESTNSANEGEWVVTNPQGEEYLVPKEKFSVKYAATGTEGVYQSRGYCRAMPNPFNEPVEILAQWGEMMRGDEHSYIVDSCDQNGIPEGEPYLIAGPVFESTYRPCAGTAV